jgi:hypothetical protein
MPFPALFAENQAMLFSSSARKTRKPWLLPYRDKSTGRARRRSGLGYGIPIGSFGHPERA